MAGGLLLDTCAFIWLSKSERMRAEALEAVKQARLRGALSLSAMTAWELGMLASKNRLHLARPALLWFADFVEAMSVTLQPPTPAILVAASFLPSPVHSDPIDRILIATARAHDLALVTRDRAILAYGAAGHVRTLAC
jgi:PIN domain nuclease of toxin-antitoxin system